MLNEQTIVLNLVPGEVPPMAHVTQDDVGREIKLVLMDNNKTFNLSSSYTYSLRGTKPSGTGFAYDDVVTVSGTNALTFKTNSVMTAAAGPVCCGIIIYDGDEHVETLNFILHVQRAALDADTIIDTSDFGSIISQAVVDWMDENGVVIDNTLSVSGAAADAETVGEAIAELQNRTEVFWATYGEQYNPSTTGETEILAAHEAGKLVLCYTNNKIYLFVGSVTNNNSSHCLFVSPGIDPDSISYLTCDGHTWLDFTVSEEPCVNLYQGTDNAGKVLVIGSDGKVDTSDELSDINEIVISETTVIDSPAIRSKNNNAVTDNNDGTFTIGTTDYGNIIFAPKLTLLKGKYLLYGVPNGMAFISTSTSHSGAIFTNTTSEEVEFEITSSTDCYLGFRSPTKPSESYTITPYIKKVIALNSLTDYVIKPFDVSDITWEYGYYSSSGKPAGSSEIKQIRSAKTDYIQVLAGSQIGLKHITDYSNTVERLFIAIYSRPFEEYFLSRQTINGALLYTFTEDAYIRISMDYYDQREISDQSALIDCLYTNITQSVNPKNYPDPALDNTSENSVQNKIVTDAINAITPVALTTSWKNKIEDINTAKGTKFTLAIQTDTHYYVGYGDTSAYNLKLLTNYVGFDFVANLGDVIRGYANETIDSDVNMRLAMTDIMHRYDGISCPLMIAMGNHDMNPMWASAFSGEKFSNNELWGRMFRPSFNTNPKAVTQTGKMYYYTDFNDVRVIVLNTQDGTDQGFGIGTEQLTWFINTALDTNKSVLVMSHVPLVNGWSVGSNYVSSYADIVTALQTFKANNGDVIGCFSGHTHTQESQTVDNILYVTFRNGADLAEVVMIDLEEREISTIPVGFAGVGNRSFTF